SGHLHRQLHAWRSGPWPCKRLERRVAAPKGQGLAVNAHGKAADAWRGMRAEGVPVLKLTRSARIERPLDGHGLIEETQQSRGYLWRRVGIADVSCTLESYRVLQISIVKLRECAARRVKEAVNILESSIRLGNSTEGERGSERAKRRAQPLAAHRRGRHIVGGGDGIVEKVLNHLVDMAVLINGEALADLLRGRPCFGCRVPTRGFEVRLLTGS